MLALLLELLRSEAESLPELVVSSIWYTCAECIDGRPAVAWKAVKSGCFDLGVAHLCKVDSVDQLVRCFFLLTHCAC